MLLQKGKRWQREQSERQPYIHIGDEYFNGHAITTTNEACNNATSVISPLKSYDGLLRYPISQARRNNNCYLIN